MFNTRCLLLLLCFALLSSFLPACAVSSFTPCVGGQVIDPNATGLSPVTGYSHSRLWRVELFKCLRFGNTLDPAVVHASAAGLGTVVDLDVHMEDYTVNPGAYNAHYGGFFPLLIGTECTYATATYAH